MYFYNARFMPELLEGWDMNDVLYFFEEQKTACEAATLLDKPENKLI